MRLQQSSVHASAPCCSSRDIEKEGRVMNIDRWLRLIGGGFVLSAFAKCFFPAHTGVWISDGKLVSSGTLFDIPPAPAHDVAGWLYVPAALALGSVLILGTSFVIRSALRLSQLVQSRLDLSTKATAAR